MKVCMLVGTDMSHDARVWKEALTLAQVGHKVTVLAAHNDRLPPEEHRDGVRILRVAPSEWRKRKMANTPPAEATTQPSPPADSRALGVPKLKTVRAWLWTIRLLAKMLAHIKELAPDILHIHDADRLFPGVLAHLILRKPFLYDSHEYLAGMLPRNGWRNAARRTWYDTLERAFLRRGAAVITVNTLIEKKLLDRYRLRRTVVVHNYPLCHQLPEDGSVLRSMLPERYRAWPVLLYQGRLTAERGIEVFIVVVAMVPGTVGVVIGSGPIEGELKRLALNHGLGDRLLFVPQVPWDQLLRYTPGADLGFCLSPNTCENNYLSEPNKLFEYLMAGVPVVASDFPAIRECVVGEDVGIVVPPDDPRRIATAVQGLLGQKDRLRGMRERALHVSRTKYHWEITARNLVRLYSALEEELNNRRQ